MKAKDVAKYEAIEQARIREANMKKYVMMGRQMLIKTYERQLDLDDPKDIEVYNKRRAEGSSYYNWHDVYEGTGQLTKRLTLFRENLESSRNDVAITAYGNCTRWWQELVNDFAKKLVDDKPDDLASVCFPAREYDNFIKKLSYFLEAGEKYMGLDTTKQWTKGSLFEGVEKKTQQE